jgi:hypothetical protein
VHLRVAGYVRSITAAGIYLLWFNVAAFEARSLQSHACLGVSRQQVLLLLLLLLLHVQVLMANMRQELLALAKPHQQQQEESCTDVLLSLPAAHAPPLQRLQSSSSMQPSNVTLVGHNEDMTRDTVGRIYFVRYNADSILQANPSAATRSRRSHSSRRLLWHQAPYQQLATSKQRHLIVAPTPLQDHTTGPSKQHTTFTSSSSSSSGNVSWLGFVYAGELPSSGFGINSAGIGFSLNAVFPAVPIMPGFSRNFVSRQLLQARSIKEALHIITRPGQVRLNSTKWGWQTQRCRALESCR